MELSRERPGEGRGLLYPMMVIAAIAVIVFSILGIAAITGWMPSALSGSTAGERTGVAFDCGECSIIESVRDIERRISSHTPVRFDALAFPR